jgi:hypothetical protein
MRCSRVPSRGRGVINCH